MLNRFTILAVSTVLGVFLHSTPLFAQTGAPATKPDFTARLIVGGTDKADPALAWLGLKVRLGRGWHTYWRSAGDAGAPPEFDWSGSQNVVATTVEWPAPHRFTDAGIDTFGYADEVLFPVKVRLQDPHARVTFRSSWRSLSAAPSARVTIFISTPISPPAHGSTTG